MHLPASLALCLLAYTGIGQAAVAISGGDQKLSCPDPSAGSLPTTKPLISPALSTFGVQNRPGAVQPSDCNGENGIGLSIGTVAYFVSATLDDRKEYRTCMGYAIVTIAGGITNVAKCALIPA